MRLSRSLAVLTLGVLAGACGGSASTPPTPAPPPNTNITIKTATLTVDGKPVTALTDSLGMTLYWTTIDYSNQTNCTGSCASTWPPLLAVLGNPVPDKGVTLSGQLTTILGGNGRQVEYNGHPLYRYSKESGPGMTLGQGVANRWGVATADVAAASPAPSPSPSK